LGSARSPAHSREHHGQAQGPAHVVERILNHRDGVISGVAAIYNQFDYRDECAEALEKLGEFIVSLAAPRVVPLRRA
jgi:hypothetical protein